MKTPAMISASLLCAACAATAVPGGSTLSDGSRVFTLKCDDSWAACYSAAREACGPGGFEEIDRVVDGSLSNAGRMQTRVFIEGGRENEVYDESVRTEVSGRAITIRCKSS